ncbi:hypothetical protein F3Y22_tig00111008pilonHSYRG00238 [Hibiscus syriacus]|uniref:Uncharacterized protein n=1 Tax=Hibiscus syriacus TaxID=106335 RepID=A0A6A2Z889_HIBSY|nr:hypothetical protein F3Y22_tig00111008pilonHSYRG00238 [Hibiscus syriacus]
MGRIDFSAGDFGSHPVLPLSLFVAVTAATIAIITGFCAFWRRSEPDLEEDSSETAESSPVSDVLHTTEQATTTAEDEEEETKELPPPPCMRALTMTNPSVTADRCPSLMKKSVSTRKISSASVKKHFKSMSVREIIDKNTHKPDDSLCKKHIILGGKCRLASQVDDGNNNMTQSSLENPEAIDHKDKEEEGP